MDRVTAKCRDCCFFEFRDDIPKALHERRFFPIDGFCNKIFPRGYVGSGKPGGFRCSFESTCFQFEFLETSQISFEL